MALSPDWQAYAEASAAHLPPGEREAAILRFERDCLRNRQRNCWFENDRNGWAECEREIQALDKRLDEIDPSRRRPLVEETR